MRLTQNYLKSLIETKVKKILKEEEVSDELTPVSRDEAYGASEELPLPEEPIDPIYTSTYSQGGLIPDPEPDSIYTSTYSQGGLIPDPEPADLDIGLDDGPAKNKTTTAKKTSASNPVVTKLQNTLRVMKLLPQSGVDGIFGKQTFLATKRAKDIVVSDLFQEYPNDATKKDLANEINNIDLKRMGPNELNYLTTLLNKAAPFIRQDLNFSSKDYGQKGKLKKGVRNPTMPRPKPINFGKSPTQTMPNNDQMLSGAETELKENTKFKMSYVEKVIREEYLKELAKRK